VKLHRAELREDMIAEALTIGASHARLVDVPGAGANRPYTLERLLRDENVVSLAAEFLGLRESEIGWNRKGYAFAWGPVTRKSPNGIYTLPEMCAAKRDGLRQLSSSENAVWGKRLFVEMGLIDPVPVQGHEGHWLRWRVRRHEWATGKRLWAKWSTDEQTWARLRVLAGFRLLVGISWLDILHSPVTFTREFASRWCGIGKQAAYEATRQLEQDGEIEHVGEHKRAKLWLPKKKSRPHDGPSPKTTSSRRIARPRQSSSEDSGNGKPSGT
jgi:hypothetical protein